MAGFLWNQDWFEQRLEQHQAGIEAQLKQHQAEVTLAIENGYRALQQHLLSQRNGAAAATPAAASAAPSQTPVILDYSDVQRPEHSQSKSQQQQKQQLDGKFSVGRFSSRILLRKSTVSRTTSLHSLVDEGSLSEQVAQNKVKFILDTVMVHVINFCIVANTVSMFMHLQWLGTIADNSLGVASTGSWPHAENIFNVLECFFAVVFSIDLVMQIFAYRHKFFMSAFNNLDFAIVVLTTVEVFILTPLAASVGNLSVVRLLKLAKLTRVLKAVRTFKAFESLRILISTMTYCIASTFWSLVILIVFQIMGAIFMCQSLHDYIVDESNSEESREWVNAMYGDGVKSFWTIFELTFSGCWPNYARRIIEEVNPWYRTFYFGYVYIVVFVMTRIVAALFTKETFGQAAQDTEMMVKARSRKTAFLKQKLAELFDEADTSGDGNLDPGELGKLLDHPRVSLWMKELGVDISDAEALFALLHDGTGNISKEEFVTGLTKLRGEARSSDLLPVVSNVQRILGHVKVMRHTVEDLAKRQEAFSV